MPKKLILLVIAIGLLAMPPLVYFNLPRSAKQPVTTEFKPAAKPLQTQAPLAGAPAEIIPVEKNKTVPPSPAQPAAPSQTLAEPPVPNFSAPPLISQPAPINDELDVDVPIYLPSPAPKQTAPGCLTAGQKSGSQSDCCAGLRNVFVGYYSALKSCEELSRLSAGAGVIYYVCANCGNKTCESWENRCNCPTDCHYP